jgi:hypothetical protein
VDAAAEWDDETCDSIFSFPYSNIHGRGFSPCARENESHVVRIASFVSDFWLLDRCISM